MVPDPERAPKWYLDFCQAVRRQAVLNIGGFDEKFEGYGLTTTTLLCVCKHRELSTNGRMMLFVTISTTRL